MFDGPTLLGLQARPGGTTMPRRDRPISALLADPAVQERMKNPALPSLKVPSTEEPDIQDMRALTLADLEDAKVWTRKKAEGQREPQGQSMLRLRERHHSIARLLAAGLTPTQIGEMIGMAPSSISNIQKSPAFQSLLFSYAAENEKAASDFKSRLEATAGAALNELHERLVNNPEEFSAGVLLQTVNSLADRTGHGPTQKVLNTTVALTPADIRALKAGLAPAQIEAKELELTSSAGAGPDGPVPAVRGPEGAWSLGPEGVPVPSEGGALPSEGVPE